MRKRALVALVISLIALAACENSSTSGAEDLSPDLGKKGAYQDAELLIHDLNDHLRRAGVSECAMKNPDLETGYAERIPNEGASVCEFNDGTPLYVLIVRNGEATYKRHFGRQFGPNVYSWGPTWVLITSSSAPYEARTEIPPRLGGSV
jgi:hypothetical protein